MNLSMASSCSFSDLPDQCMAAYGYDEKKGMIIDGLEEGREFAIQVRGLLARVVAGEISYEDAEISARDMTSSVMKSFANSLYFLGQNDAAKIGNESNSSPVSSNQHTLDAPKMEDSGESISRDNDSPSAKGLKDRRGSYKRRKSSNSWRRETPNLVDDGHAWRKYGQKLIHNADYPRNYYRCTHKYEQQCPATKHVQKIRGQPPMYRTTYYGHHTCRNILTAPELVLDCPSPTESSSFFLSFNSPNSDPRFVETSQPFFPTATNHVKREVITDNEAPTMLDVDVKNVSDNRSGLASTSSFFLPDDAIRDDPRSVFDPSSSTQPKDMMDMEYVDDDEVLKQLYYDLMPIS